MAEGRPTLAGIRDLAVTIPVVPAHAIDRPAVSDRLTQSVDRFRVTVLFAPAGFGKTAALSAWANQSGRRVTWFSLGKADGHGEHLRRRLSSVMDLVAHHTDQRKGSEPKRVRVDDGSALPVLVIDDIQLADSPGSRKVLSAVLERTDPSVRIVLSGRFDPKLGLSRLRVSGDLAEIPSSELAFTAAEVRLAARALGRTLDSAAAEQLLERTGGWPVAVRLALMSDAGRSLGPPGIGPVDHLPQFVDYLLENLLDLLPARLAAFLPLACVCDQITGPLADQLSDTTNGAELLEAAVDLGIPLERRILPTGETLYVWHPVMAQAGRALLMRRDPTLVRELHVRAARYLASADPYEAAQQAFLGRDPELAASIIGSQWLALALRNDFEIVDELCCRLPAPWSDDAEILIVLATCRRSAGSGDSASELGARALATAVSLGPVRRRSFDVTFNLAQLFLADDEDALIAACAPVQALVDASSGLDGPLRACAILLLGWSKMRIRRSQEAVALLSEAILRCGAEGLHDLVDRARASLAFSRAFSGDFAGALAVSEVSRAGGADRTWRRADGAVEAFTEGWVNFWSGNTDGAIAGFREAVTYGGALTSFEPLARVWLVHATLAAGTPNEIADAEECLRFVPDETIQGLPWRHYKLITKAGTSVYRGDLDNAVRMLDEGVAINAFVPAIRVLAAELFWTCGRREQTRAQLEQVLQGPAYLRASGLVLSALCARSDGEDARAGGLLEEALGLGVTLQVARPFQFNDPALSALLVEHAERGSRHDDFLAEQVAWHARRRQPRALQPLSAREREILGFLATRRSADEICAELFISRNTLKTHLKSIYRKLGVDNRRDAYRFAQAMQTP